MKFFWAIIFFGALWKTGQQAYESFHYYSKSTIIKRVSKIEEIHFPAVTVCSNVLFKWPLPQDIVNRSPFFKDPGIIRYESDYERIRNLRNDVFELSSDDLLRIGHRVDEYIKTCRFLLKNSSRECSEFVERAVRGFGNCATINAGLLNGNVDNDETINNNINELIMELSFNPTKRYPQLLYIFGVSLIIHPKGTSFINKLDESILIRPGVNYSISYTTTINTRLPEPYPSKCVSQYLPEEQWKNIFHDTKTQYLYTKEQCLSSCTFNFTYDICHNSKDLSYLGRRQYDLNKTDGVLNLNDLKCSQQPPWESCNCKIPCRDVHHNIIIENMNNTNTKKISFVKVNEVHDALHSNGKLPPSWISLKPKTSFSDLIAEQPAIQLTALLIEIGGTLGLWVGISLLSFIELNTLLLPKIFKFFANLFRKK